MNTGIFLSLWAQDFLSDSLLKKEEGQRDGWLFGLRSFGLCLFVI